MIDRPPDNEARFDNDAWDEVLDDDKPVEEMNESELIQYRQQCQEYGVQP